MELPLLRDFVIIFGLAIIVLLVCHRLRIPTIVGFILTGVLGGPHGLGLVRAVGEVDTFAKIGIILLLFTIGMEFSPRRILAMRKSFLVGGFLQVGFTVLGGFIAAQLFGRPVPESIFLGFLLSLSSTAIILKLMSDRGEAKSRHGRIILAILIFQDIAVVLMMLLVPFLAGKGEISLEQVLWVVGEGALIIVAAFVFALKVVPPVLDLVARTRSRELFLLAVLTICFSVTWLSSLAGLSISLGAFLSGMILSESEYRHQALGNILPFQDIFTSFFFISIGLLLELDFFFFNIFTIVGLCLGVLVLKTLVAGASTLVLGMPLRTAILVGFSLSQVGEFSFVLVNAGIESQISEPYLYQLFIAVSLLSMLLTPLLVTIAPHFANFVSKFPLSERLVTGKVQYVKEERGLTDHVIIAGFGVSGKNLAKSCQISGIKYCVLETNPDIVRDERKRGEPIYFGDSGHISVLEHVNIKYAKVFAVLVNDPTEEKRIIEAARHANPKVFIVTRTHTWGDRETMYQLGADDVVVDEFVTSAETVNRILLKYNISYSEVDKCIDELSGGDYQKRALHRETFRFSDLDIDLPQISVEAWKVEQGCYLSEKTMHDTGLRRKYGVNVLVINREEDKITEIDHDTVIKEGDILVVFGKKDNLASAIHL
ncbi:MAG: Glutathione-regulated potassium-efflux system protein KefC, partial [Chlamydiae bacterium]|nr:Glutathione-regulated potassium-efflux system protein KefC [Chlamydiota bacterium]